jgi:methyl-accepting chemotaxis protein
MTQTPSQPSSNLSSGQNGTSRITHLELTSPLPTPQPASDPDPKLIQPGKSGRFGQRKRSMRAILIIPFVLQLSAAVGLVGYLSFRNGQQAVNQLAGQVMDKTNNLVEQQLETYLTTPHQINQMNVAAVRLGQLNLQDYQGMGKYFWQQMKVFNAGYIAYSPATGGYAGAGYFYDPKQITTDELSGNTGGKLHTYEMDSEGNRTKLSNVADYDPHKDAWYQDPVRAGKPVWSRVYSWDGFPDIMSISAGHPIYSKAGNLIGVINVDFRLSQISSFLRKLDFSPEGKVFVIERDGMLIGSSSGTEQPFRVVDNKAVRLNALNSKDPLIQATARELQQQFSSFKNITENQQLDFQINGSRQYAQVTPWRDQYGLDWLVVVAVPESDFMAQINANTRTTVFLCVLALIIAILLGLITARWITESLGRLNQATQSLANGQLDQPLEAQNIKELDTLGNSFNQMATQLRNSFAALETTNRTLEQTNQDLEQRVEERTAELRAAKEISDQSGQWLQQRALQLLQEVDPVSTGDLTIRAQVTADEIGTIADACNAMVENLRKIVLQVQTAASQVVEATRDNEGSVQVLSAEAARQAAESTVALQRIEEIVAVVRSVADHAQQAEQVVQEAAQSVQEGDMAMNRTVEGIQTIRTTVAKTAKKVKHLGESSQKISMVVELIGGFANQTRLLALNASIEAALAGKEGRGFALVAEEVRALAKRSTEATEEIRKLVSNIQAETNEVVMTMESSTEEVVMGSKLVDETRQSLDKITAASLQVSQLVQSINQATTIQFQASEDVAETVKEMATLATKTSTEAHQVSTSFEQLRQVAQALQADVAQFKVE